MDILRSILSSIFAEVARDRINLGLAAHANRRKPGDPAPTSVRTMWSLRVVGVLVCTVVVPIAVIVIWASIIGKPINDAWIAAPIFGAIAIWLCLACYDGFFRRIEWNETEVQFRKWNGARTVSWEDIVGLEEKSYPPHFRIVFRDGTGFAIDETMLGSRYFMGILDRRLHPEGLGPTGNKRRKRRQRGKKS